MSEVSRQYRCPERRSQCFIFIDNNNLYYLLLFVTSPILYETAYNFLLTICILSETAITMFFILCLFSDPRDSLKDNRGMILKNGVYRESPSILSFYI